MLPFVALGDNDTTFELPQPFNLGEPIMIETPNGRLAILAHNKYAFYPVVCDANNPTAYLNETDMQYTIDGTEKAINSGIIVPSPMPASSAGVIVVTRTVAVVLLQQKEEDNNQQH